MLRYENKKTGSVLNIPGEQKINEVDDWTYIIKMMVYNDLRIYKSKITDLAIVLNKIKEDR